MLSEIFYEGGLDDPNQLETTKQIKLFAQANVARPKDAMSRKNSPDLRRSAQISSASSAGLADAGPELSWIEHQTTNLGDQEFESLRARHFSTIRNKTANTTMITRMP